MENTFYADCATDLRSQRRISYEIELIWWATDNFENGHSWATAHGVYV